MTDRLVRYVPIDDEEGQQVFEHFRGEIYDRPMIQVLLDHPPSDRCFWCGKTYSWGSGDWKMYSNFILVDQNQKSFKWLEG